MLEAQEDKGVHKNACYALSCLCTTEMGYQMCLQSISTFHRILLAVEKILNSVEHETVWFALMYTVDFVRIVFVQEKDICF